MSISHKQFLKFLFGGAVAALVNVCSRYLFNNILSYKISIILAYIVGMVTAFVIFKFLVFNANQTHKTEKEILWFVAVNVAAFAQTFIVSLFLANYLFPLLEVVYHPKDIAHVIGVMIPVVTSYIGHKKLTFSQTVFL